MSQVEDTTLGALTQQERTELVAAIGGKDWVSEQGDGLVWLLFVALLGIAGLGSGVVNFSELTELFSFIAEYPSEAPRALLSVFFLGPVAGLAACVFSVVYFLRVNGRFGWAATRFALVRVRGEKLRLMRYVNLATITQERFGGGRRGRRFTETTLTAKDGSVLKTYATPLIETVKQRAGV